MKNGRREWQGSQAIHRALQECPEEGYAQQNLNVTVSIQILTETMRMQSM